MLPVRLFTGICDLINLCLWKRMRGKTHLYNCIWIYMVWILWPWIMTMTNSVDVAWTSPGHKHFGENNYTYIQDSWLSNSRLLAGVYRIIKYFDIVSLCAQKALEVPFFPSTTFDILKWSQFCYNNVKSAHFARGWRSVSPYSGSGMCWLSWVQHPCLKCLVGHSRQRRCSQTWGKQRLKHTMSRLQAVPRWDRMFSGSSIPNSGKRCCQVPEMICTSQNLTVGLTVHSTVS